MRPKDKDFAEKLAKKLRDFSKQVRSLPGIANAKRFGVLVEQIVESERRIRFVATIRQRKLSPNYANPASEIFDPIRAAILSVRQGDLDEAAWLVFLSTHFGKSRRSGWRFSRDIYGRLGKGNWSWKEISKDPKSFDKWLNEYDRRLKLDGPRPTFGNHRKYESLKKTSAVIGGFINWIKPFGSFAALLKEHSNKVGDKGDIFDSLYESMSVIPRFGRTAKFDYLTMAGKVGIVNINPAHAYLKEATGPLIGAMLLFGEKKKGSKITSKLDEQTAELGNYLGVGMQIMEDSLCNWQKSPESFKRFRG